jgi:hypothetical protein
LPDLNLDEWNHMFGESTYQHPLDDDGRWWYQISRTRTLDLRS